MKLFDKGQLQQPLRLQDPKPWMIILVLLLNLVAILAMIHYRNASSGAGYPLDDSWIHQTYARNLADSGNWGYSLNDKSAGSTSPLWTILLIPGFLFGADNPYVWTMILSILCYWGLLVVALKFVSRDQNLNNTDVIVFGIIMAIEWHFLWATGSGMETMLFISITFLIFYLLHKEQPNGYLIGLLTGVLVFIRPDGLTLLGPILFVFITHILQKKFRIITLVGFFIFLLIPLVLYGIHNYSLSGSILPNTFSAKTQEYKELLQSPIIFRVFKLSTVLISGVGIFLLPGFLWKLFKAIKHKNMWEIAAILWIFGFILLYALRLPVNYQHGRYLMPVIPIYLLLGFQGSSGLLTLLPIYKQKGYKNIANISLVITSLVFFSSGILAYSEDVKIINTLMVKPALWLNVNTAPAAIIAAHDIGAIGYFSERKIIDLAGLINPEIVPFIRDEDKLIEYIEESKADYLVIITDWYQELNKLGKRLELFEYSNGSTSTSVEIRKIN